MRFRLHYWRMGKPRIIVTCPATGIAAITDIAYAEMVEPRTAPKFFRCPCGETHKLRFAGKHASLRQLMAREAPQAS